MGTEGMNGSYHAFLRSKRFQRDKAGFDPVWLPDFLFQFQRYLVEWATRTGRAALFCECGMGKTPMQLVWAENVLRKINRKRSRVLMLTPLAVGAQTVREGIKFGITAHQTRKGSLHPRINVTNYERLGHFNPKDFDAVVCDESSCLKSFGGSVRREITEFMNKVQYRLLCSATPAPNDFVELGNSSEAMGEMGRNNMLRMFFINDDDPVGNIESTHHWRLKGHGGRNFWRWVASWARAIRRPSDLGFSDDGFILPELQVQTCVLKVPGKKVGFFPKLARTLDEQRQEKKRTLRERCEEVASLLRQDEPAVIWCHLNDEGKLLRKLIPDAVEVCGSDSIEDKEDRLTGFSEGRIRTLITKPRIGGFGLNWQHCSQVFYFPSHSFEQYYQAIRRCWRFGQTRPVDVKIIMSEAERLVTSNMLRKERQAEEMYAGIMREMAALQTVKAKETKSLQMEAPLWSR